MAELTKEEMDKIREIFQQIMGTMDDIRKEKKEMIEKLDDMIMDMRNDTKLFREELRNDRIEELKNDSKPGTEDIPNDKTKEQVVVLPEIKTNRNKENTKQRGMKSKKMRRMYPRNLIKTKEEREMMNHGLIDVNNIPITNNRCV